MSRKCVVFLGFLLCGLLVGQTQCLQDELKDQLQDQLQDEVPTTFWQWLAEHQEFGESYDIQIEKEIRHQLQNYSFCIGDDMGYIMRLLKDSFKPEEFFYNESFAGCGSFLEVQPYLCTPTELRMYEKYHLPSNNDPEKIPDTSYCKAGQLNASCEPGFFNLGGSMEDIPQKCCEGYFCPRMLTCMIPCPQGAHCPHANTRPPPPDYLLPGQADNNSWCSPYAYKERTNTGCGGANEWTILPGSPFPRGTQQWIWGGGSIYCGWGQYCPTPTEFKICSPGHYCKRGSDAQAKCAPLVHCPVYTSVPASDYIGLAVVVCVFSFFVLCWLLVQVYQWITGGISQQERMILTWNGPKQFTANVIQYQSRDSQELQEYMVEAETDSAKEETEREIIPTTKSWDFNNGDTATQPLISKTLPRHRRLRHRRNTSSISNGHDYISSPLSLHTPSRDSMEGATSSHQDRPDSPFLTPELALQTISSRGHSRQSSMAQDLTPLGGRSSMNQSRIELALNQVSGELARDHDREVGDSRITIEGQGQAEELSPFIIQTTPTEQQYQSEQISNNRFSLNIKFIGLGYRLKMGKTVIQSVSGKLRSERITAIMGPSGAGKTTLMTILAGKQQAGGQQFGVILLNNQVVQSLARYRGVMGFVPQEDIMYSDLSVYETLLFSARYRLPATTSDYMRKQYVENAMEILNIVDIRHQVIGNQERRGISGGQRKRVNVAIELVMNPSLLFLDEPTSGLDSTTSKILVEALKQTAQLGVTVCAVVHQPSYQVFQNFDDVLFLGPGGRTVYYGPVSNVYNYFNRLDFVIPEHVNPADAYMDIINGFIGREGHPDHRVEDLYLLWQEHAGIDMGVVEQIGIQSVDLDVEQTIINLVNRQTKQFEIMGGEQGLFLQAKEILLVNVYWVFSSVKELWQILVASFARLRHWYYPTAATESYLPLRITPGVWTQLRWCLQRAFQRRLRHKLVSTLELLIFCVTGAILGYISDRGWGTLFRFSQGISYAIIGIALLSSVSSLRTFGTDRPVFFREIGSGLNRISYFLAMDSIDHINTVLRAVFFLMIYKSFAEFRANMWSMFGIMIGIVYTCAGYSYIISQIMGPGPGQLTAAVMVLIFVLMAPKTDMREGISNMIQQFSFARWALEGLVIAEANELKGVWLLARCQDLVNLHYDVRDFPRCMVQLFMIGVGARILALLGFYVLHRSKQR